MTAPKIKKLTETLTAVGDKVRVESGPARLTATATAELLSDGQTAKHYRAGALDADGNRIIVGEAMTYLAWGGDEAAPQQVHYVYRLTPRPLLDPGTGQETGLAEEDPNHWVEAGVFETEADALDAARAFASA